MATFFLEFQKKFVFFFKRDPQSLKIGPNLNIKKIRMRPGHPELAGSATPVYNIGYAPARILPCQHYHIFPPEHPRISPCPQGCTLPSPRRCIPPLQPIKGTEILFISFAIASEWSWVKKKFTGVSGCLRLWPKGVFFS